MNRHPVLFLSHGAPPLADDPRWPGELASWSASLPKPKDILMVSAHWEKRPIALSATRRPVELLYDFWGFPDKYYQVRYDAPLAPELADETERLLAGRSVTRDENRGLDHGAYVPLVEMYPDADIPVTQLSLPSLNPQELFEVGQALAPLRDRGTLIVGSGFTTHNLRWFAGNPDADSQAPAPSAEFDQWAAEAMAAGDLDALLDFQHQAPASRIAHPRTEHWAPLYVSLGAAYAGGEATARTTVDGFWYGLSKRSWQLD